MPKKEYIPPPDRPLKKVTQESYPPVFEEIIDFCEDIYNINEEKVPDIIEKMKDFMNRNIVNNNMMLVLLDKLLLYKSHEIKLLRKFIGKFLDSYEFDISDVKERDFPLLYICLSQRGAKPEIPEENFEAENAGRYEESHFAQMATEGTLANSIITDDVETFNTHAAQPGFQANQRIINLSLIDLAASYGSVNVFKVLYNMDMKIDSETFIQAIYGKNLEIIHLVERKVKPDQKCMDLAITYHFYDLIDYFLQNYDLKISIKKCIKSYNFRTFFDLMARVGDPDYSDSNKNTALMQLSRLGIMPFVNYFIDCGANLDLKNNKGKTAAYYAVKNNQNEVLKTLLYWECYEDNFFASDMDGTLAHIASKMGKTELLKSLFAFNIEHEIDFKCDLETPDRFGLTLLMCAIISGNFETVKYLVELGAKINARDDERQTPFLHACNYCGDNIEILQYLLDHGADMNAVDAFGFSALSDLCDAGSAKGLEFVLNRGADVNTRNRFGTTPLLKVSEINNPEIIRILLEHNADVNIPGADRQTPIIKAAQFNIAETVRMLIEHKAKLNVRDRFMKSPLDYCIENNGNECAKLLIEAGAEHSTRQLIIALSKNNLEIAKLMIDHGANLNDYTEISPMHACIFKGQLEAVQLLVEHNVDINRPDKDMSPLKMAVLRDETLIAKYLIEKGANIFIHINKVSLITYLIVTNNTAVLSAIKKKYRDLWDSIIDE